MREQKQKHELTSPTSAVHCLTFPNENFVKLSPSFTGFKISPSEFAPSAIAVHFTAQVRSSDTINTWVRLLSTMPENQKQWISLCTDILITLYDVYPGDDLYPICSKLLNRVHACIVWLYHACSYTVGIYPPKFGYPSAKAPCFDFELQFLVAAATWIEIESQKWFCTVFYGVSMDEDDWNSSEQLCLPKRLP